MKVRFLFLTLLTGCCFAAEPVILPYDLGKLRTRNGREYEAVKVVGRDAVGIKISHDGGTARINYDMLPDDVAARFTKDPVAAKVQLEKEAAEQAANDKAMAVPKPDAVNPPKRITTGADIPSTEDDDLQEQDAAVETLPSSDGKTTAERIAMLEGYVRRLDLGIVQTKERISQLQGRLAQVRSYATQANNNSGNISNLGWKRANYIDKSIQKEQAKLKLAYDLAGNATVEIRDLTLSLSK